MEKIIVLDFGGQYNQLIARRVRQTHVYSEVLPYVTSLDVLSSPDIKGIIFTGGPNSVYDSTSPHIDKKIFELGKPILGICYGAQLMAYTLGGEVGNCNNSEFGNIQLSIHGSCILTNDIPPNSNVFMSHNDEVKTLPNGFSCVASSPSCKNSIFVDEERKLYATQFHPEVEHSEYGQKIIENFVLNICDCKPTWKPSSFIDDKIKEIREQVGDKKVLCALSGGVDSSVVAALIGKAIGDNLTCVFVDHGLLRKNEAKQVIETFGNKDKFHFNFIPVDASKAFLSRLENVIDPEQKRKIIGKTFVDVFKEEKKKLPQCEYLAQGTIYPDRIESGLGISHTIKSHHNVGGLPKDIGFIGLVEPLKDLFKDEVRELGLLLGIPENIVFRQPFPGPGLGIRIIGGINEDKIKIVQDADYIFREEIEKAGLSTKINQYFAALSNMRSVGVMGDGRTYDYTVVLRAVTTDDFMTAKAANIPYEIITNISNRIVNEVKGVNRVVYDFTSKPPSTIELE